MFSKCVQVLPILPYTEFQVLIDDRERIGARRKQINERLISLRGRIFERINL